MRSIVSRYPRVAHASLLFLFLIAQPALAQPRGITGVVRDPQQAVIAGAQVILTNARTTAKVTVATDGQGRYGFDALLPDRYVVEVHAQGFQVATSPEITLGTGDGVTRDFTLAVAGATDSVTVTGSADQRYRVETVSSLGPSGPLPILDTPYTVSILPGELMVNAQVKSFKEASKYLPLMEFQEMQGSEILRPATRGMQGSNMQNARMDGMGIVVTGANSVESLQQIEALNGLGAALYGPANPSGMFNFVPKRPTDRPVRQVTFGYDAQTVATVHADVGGRAGSNQMFGYRANMLFGNGEAFVTNSDLTRRLASLAGDVRPFANTVVEGFYSYYNVEQRGFPGWFTYGRASAATPFVKLPQDAPDPARDGFGQESAGLDLQTRIGELRVKHDFGANWHLSAGALDQLVTRDISTQVNALTNEAGSYTASLATGFAPQFHVFSDLAHVNGRFDTRFVRHDVAIGTTGYTFKSYSDVTNPSAASVRLGTASISDPVVFALPAAGIPLHENIYMSSVIHQQGFSLADTATLSKEWSIRAAVSQDWIWTDNFNNRSVRTGGYEASGASPLVSLLYKPVPRMTVYGTYGSSLQQGDIAPGTVVNAGEALPAYRSKQGEIGYKMALLNVDLSTAVFRLNRPFATTDPTDNIYKISGDQVNYGVEATLTGRVAGRLLIYGGFTILDPTLTKTGNATTDGKQFVGIPRFKSNLLTEYRLPVGTGTFASVNWQSVGRRAIDDINSAYTPSYNVIDVGMRYRHAIVNTLATWRLTINNVTNVHYWSTLGPGNITGTAVGSYTAHFGAPRTLSASMEVAF